MVFGMVIPLGILAALGALVAIAVFIVARLRAGEPLGLSFRTILVGYFHLMSIVAVLVLATGLTTLLKAGMSEAFGREFSYWMPPPMVARPVPVEPGAPAPRPAQPTPEQIEEQRQRELRRIDLQVREDLIQGGTLALVSALLWPLHAWGRRRIVLADNAWLGFFGRAHLIILLLLFSLVGIVSLPMGLYQLLRFFLLPVAEDMPRQPPGESVAAAIVFVPLWVFSLVTALRQMRRERA
jgi:hypothetical protein